MLVLALQFSRCERRIGQPVKGTSGAERKYNSLKTEEKSSDDAFGALRRDRIPNNCDTRRRRPPVHQLGCLTPAVRMHDTG